MMKLVFLFRNRENPNLWGSCLEKNLLLFVEDSYIYRFMKTVISLTTVPTFKDSRKSGVYFHDCHGGYKFLLLFSITVVKLVISNDGREVIQKM